MYEQLNTILQTNGLCKNYGRIAALDGLDLSIPAGKIVGLLGPNGSGKTTLIKMAAGLIRPTRGQITVCGAAPGADTKALVSYLPDRSALYPWMTVEDILGFFGDFYADFDMSRARDMLSRLKVPLDGRFRSLSKGTQERVQLVLVMSRRARLYLLDEPIGGVDPATRELILDTIISNYNEDSTVLISTHLITDVERVLDEFVFLQNGKLLMQGSADDVRTNQGLSLDQLFREVFKC